MRSSTAVGGGSRAGTLAGVASLRASGAAAPITALVFVALSWGGAFSVIKDTLATVSPASLVTWRFAIAAAVLLLVRPRSLAGFRRRTMIRGGALGLLLGAGFLLHTWGMQTTSVVVSAFITGSVVVFAPLVALVCLRRKLSRRSLLAILLATTGLAMITVRGAAFGRGELLIGVAALLWAVHLVALERWTTPNEIYQTTLIQLGVVAGLGAVVELGTTGSVTVPTGASALLALVSLGAVATAAAFVALTWAQTRTDATTSAVVLTLEPVFGAATAVMLGESLSLPVTLGAVAVVAAAWVVARPQPQLVLAA